MKFSTRLKYIFAALIMGAIVVFDHLWAGWLPNNYPYAVGAITVCLLQSVFAWPSAWV